jgi:hypothetical protein
MRRGKPHTVILPRRPRDTWRTLQLDAQSCYSRGFLPSSFLLPLARLVATGSSKKLIIDPQLSLLCRPPTSSLPARSSALRKLGNVVIDCAGNLKSNQARKFLPSHKKRAADLGRPEIPGIILDMFAERRAVPGQLAAKAPLG